MNSLYAIFLGMLVAIVCVDQARMHANFFSYEVSTNSINSGDGVLTEIEERKFDSSKKHGRSYTRNKFFQPFADEDRNEKISRQQLMTNRIGTGFELNPFTRFRKRLGNRFSRARGLTSTARTVESPALSVDSGGRSSGSSVASEIARILNVKQGHYADLYDRIDRPNMSTKQPADALEDAMRSAVQQVFINQDRQQQRASSTTKSP